MEEEEEGGVCSKAPKDGAHREKTEKGGNKSSFTAGESECSPPSETVD